MKKTALITGASAGLGRELAQLFAADKHDVVLVARRRDQLEELATRLTAEHGVVASVIPADLADPASPARIVEELERRNLAIEFLVNSAGFGGTGRFFERELGRDLEMVQVNIKALVHLTGLLLPAMVARKSGRILNMGSTAGFQPGPFMATYYATKGFVNSWTEALARELRGTGVTATVVCPGATNTEFGAVSGNGTSRLFRGRDAGDAGRPQRLPRDDGGQGRGDPGIRQQAEPADPAGQQPPDDPQRDLVAEPGAPGEAGQRFVEPNDIGNVSVDSAPLGDAGNLRLRRASTMHISGSPPPRVDVTASASGTRPRPSSDSLNRTRPFRSGVWARAFS
jgi:uncharacterized protein